MFGNFLALLQFLGYSKINVEEDKIIVESSPTAEEHLKADYEEKRPVTSSQECYREPTRGYTQASNSSRKQNAELKETKNAFSRKRKACPNKGLT